MNKRGINFLFALIFLGLFFIQFVSAYNSFDMRTETNRLIQLIVDFGEPFLQVTLGGDYWNGQMLFEKFLLFLVLVGIVYIAIGKAPFFQSGGKKMMGVIWTISIVVPILSIRYLPYEWINTLIFTYTAFGIAMTTLVPLIIYFFFLQGMNLPSAFRKIAWILFTCVYLGLYFTSDMPTYSEWYFATAIISVALLLLDGTIQRYFLKQKWQEASINSQSEALANLNVRIKVVQDDTSLPDDRKAALLKRLNHDKEQLLKYVIMR